MKALITFFILTSSLFAHAEESWYKLLPNTFTVDMTKEQTVVLLHDRPTISTEPAGAEDSTSARYLGSVSITKLYVPRQYLSQHFAWALIPSLNFAYNKVNFSEDYAFLRNTDFTMFRTSVGYGPEVNWMTPAGVFYAQVAPGIVFSSVSWSSPADGGRAQRTFWNVASSVGYYRHVGDHFGIRLFAKFIREDSKLWDIALDSSQGFNVPVDQVSEQIVGFSLIYSI